MTLTPASVANEFATLSKVHESSMRCEHIACVNPCRGVERPRGEFALDYFGHSEVGCIIAPAETHVAEPDASSDARVLPVAISLAVFAGLRSVAPRLPRDGRGPCRARAR